MYLTRATVFSYLKDRGLVTPASLLASHFDIASAHRRNNNFLVRCNGAGLAVKQIRDWSEIAKAELSREANWYWLAAKDPRIAPLRRLMPAGRSWDPQRFILALELLPLRSLCDLAAASGRFDPARARRLGQAMALVHRTMLWLPQSSDLGEDYPGELPYFLNAEVILKMQPLNSDGTKCGGRREYIRLFRRHFRSAAAKLDALRVDWHRETLMHSDWNLANCLADPADRDAQPRIIDWELCDCGDSIWDAATLLQSYWSSWVAYPKDYDLPAIAPACRAFWQAYCEGRNFDSQTSAAQRTRAVHFAGARLLQTAWEWLASEEHLTAPVIRLMQTASNILENPEKAELELFREP